MAITDIEISGVKVAAPLRDGWLPSYMDLVNNSNRVGGVTMRFNYLGTKRTWTAKWHILTREEYEGIMDAIKPSFFPIKCYDPDAKGIVTKTFYKGDRVFPALYHFSDTESYGSIETTFIEQ